MQIITLLVGPNFNIPIMKKYITVFSIIWISVMNSQNVRDIKSLPKLSVPHLDAATGDYYKDISNEMNKFTGNWLYVQGSERVELSITKLVQQRFLGIPNIVYVDKLSIEFKYFRNGILVKESLPGFWSDLDQIQIIDLISNPIIGPNNLYDDGFSIATGGYGEPFNSNCSKPRYPSTLWLSYKTQNNTVNGVTTIGKLYWERRTRFINRDVTVTPCADNFVLPENMVFIKQP